MAVKFFERFAKHFPRSCDEVRVAEGEPLAGAKNQILDPAKLILDFYLFLWLQLPAPCSPTGVPNVLEVESPNRNPKGPKNRPPKAAEKNRSFDAPVKLRDVHVKLA